MPDSPRHEVRAANPVAVEVVRGDVVESRHRVAATVADAGGRLVHAWGDVDAAVYPRSAVKPLQALPLIETGAAERFAVSDAEIALACASHGGEPMHVEAVAAWLERLGLGEGDLECGAHAPNYAPAAAALARAGEPPTQLHNNCSGKHAGFLTAARHQGEPTAGYIERDHPAQRRVAAALAALTGVDIERAPVARDGCSIPTFAVPLAGLAVGFARFADPSGFAPGRARAIARLHAAMTAHPEMVAGSGCFCTALIRESKGTVLAKTGAEGVYAAAVPGRGLGVAIKVDDGAGRAAEVALAAVLRRIGALDDALAARLADFVAAPVVNRAGRRTGEVRPAPDWPGP